jgi:hypothetical protein
MFGAPHLLAAIFQIFDEVRVSANVALRELKDTRLPLADSRAGNCGCIAAALRHAVAKAAVPMRA